MIRLTITPNNVVPLTDLGPANLILSIRKLESRVPLSEVLVDLKDAPTLKFLYRITTAEQPSRVWKQFLWFSGGAVKMTFDVGDPWAENEFEPHRQVRADVLALITSYPTLTQIKYEVVP